MQQDVFSPGDMAGSYEIKHLIGAGGHAEVYLAVDPQGVQAAIKCLQLSFRTSEHLRARFLVEGRVLRALEDIHIVQFLDFGVAPSGVPWMAMEFIEGKLFRDYLHDVGGRLGVEPAFRFARQLAKAACAAHAHQVYHRDLKPENVIVTPGGVLKVIDFGIAKVRGWGNKTTLKTELCGTPPYMAPEQFQGETTDARTDVYALGVMLYEMCLGRHPFAQKNGEMPSQEGIQELQKRGPKPLPALLPGFPPYMWAPIARALAHDPAGRWETMLDFGEALGHALKRWLHEYRPTELPLQPPPGVTPVFLTPARVQQEAKSDVAAGSAVGAPAALDALGSGAAPPDGAAVAMTEPSAPVETDPGAGSRASRPGGTVPITAPALPPWRLMRGTGTVPIAPPVPPPEGYAGAVGAGGTLPVGVRESVPAAAPRFVRRVVTEAIKPPESGGEPPSDQSLPAAWTRARLPVRREPGWATTVPLRVAGDSLVPPTHGATGGASPQPVVPATGDGAVAVPLVAGTGAHAEAAPSGGGWTEPLSWGLSWRMSLGIALSSFCGVLALLFLSQHLIGLPSLERAARTAVRVSTTATPGGRATGAPPAAASGEVRPGSLERAREKNESGTKR